MTDDWTPEEREAFCALLTRFNGALSARMAGHDRGDVLTRAAPAHRARLLTRGRALA